MSMIFHFRATREGEESRWEMNITHPSMRDAVAHAYAMMAGGGFDAVEVYYVNTYSGFFDRSPTARVSR